jgi:hypothetical protein
MAGFEDIWNRLSQAQDGEPVSPELKPLLQRVYAEFQPERINLSSLQENLSALLEYLSGTGRTNANCWAVDLFFCLDDGWERDWADHDLPDSLHDVLADMGGALHDTVDSPEIAKNFESLPEQLLDRVRQLRARAMDQANE